MPPRRNESIDRTEEHEEFITKVAEYHEKRGTPFDPTPRVGPRHIDLLNLYNRVLEHGGYDLVSDTKASPLQWRKFAEEFIGKNQYTPAQAFQIKNVYYKNLCAYEISTHWNKTPPPREILEDVTAKGGNVMSRTLDNFTRPITKERRDLEGEGSEASPEQIQKTPKKEGDGEEGEGEEGSATRGRGLRREPPQRILFQNQAAVPVAAMSASGRPIRNTTQTANLSPAPGMSGTSTTTTNHSNGIIMNNSSTNNAASSTLASYEPSQSYPLSLKPVITPANNPDFYKLERKRKLEAHASSLAKKYRNIMLPGTGFIGPNIYVRAQLALQSGLEEEERYALHHLVKISCERGDKYRFDQFPGLAESLVKKALQVGGLFYDVEWDVSYDNSYPATNADRDDEEMLDGLRGTSNVIQKLRSRIPLEGCASVQDASFLSKLNRITEAGLIIRNMCMLEENARYLSTTIPLVFDYLAIILELPLHPQIVELRHYALETAEQVLKWSDLGPRDALYHNLLDQLETEDRGAITITLRTISRISERLPGPKRLDDIPDGILQRVQDWLLVEDEELRSACLDFIIQYTSFADGVDNLIQALDTSAPALIRQLSRLLFFGAQEHQHAVRQDKEREKEKEKDGGGGSGASAVVPKLSSGIVQELLKLDEPLRSSEWLRMCFTSSPQSEMTQISLWQAYQSTFSPFITPAFGAGMDASRLPLLPPAPMLIAGDFIKNVSSTFTGATAQVASGNKYVIKGIRARKSAVDKGRDSREGRELLRCCWRVVTMEGSRDPLSAFHGGPQVSVERECAEFFRSSEDVLKHILATHLQLPRKRARQPLDSSSTSANTNPHANGDGDASDKMDLDSHTAPPSTSTPNSSGTLTNGTASSTLGEIFDFRLPDAEGKVYKCKWSSCHRSSSDFEATKAPRTVLLTRHIQTHLPSTSTSNSATNNLRPDTKPSQTNGEQVYYTTLQDEKGDAAGVPLGAAVVLRNIARFLPRSASNSSASSIPEALSVERNEDLILDKEGEDDGEGDMVGRLFDEEVRERLFYALAMNRSLKNEVGAVVRAIGAGGG